MLNMLIVEDNILQCQQITNFVSSHANNVKLYSYAYNGKEALEIIKKQEVDFILLDLKLPSMSGVDIINYLDNNNISKYEKSIIVISGENAMISQIIHSKYIFDFIYKPINFSTLLTSINSLIETKFKMYALNNLRKQINIELSTLHYNLSHNGARYLSEAILQVYLKGEDKDNLTKDIYPIIAKKYHTTVNNVKTSILQASNYSFYECTNDEILMYFQFHSASKPNTKTIIFTIIRKLKSLYA